MIRSVSPSIRTAKQKGVIGYLCVVALALAACSDDSTAADSATTTTAPTASTIAPSTTSDHTGRKQEADCSGATPRFDDEDDDGWGYCLPEAAPTTTRPPPTTAAPTTTMSPDLGILLLGSFIETDASFRQTLADVATESDVSVDGVDLMTFETTNEGTATFVLGVSPGYSSPEIIDEIAWNLAQGYSFMWGRNDNGEPHIFRNDGGMVRVGLRLLVDGVTYEATYDHMVSIVDMRISSVDWLNATRR